jgi:hypothetical protein
VPAHRSPLARPTVTLSFSYVDPNRNSVELQTDNVGDWTQ